MSLLMFLQVIHDLFLFIKHSPFLKTLLSLFPLLLLPTQVFPMSSPPLWIPPRHPIVSEPRTMYLTMSTLIITTSLPRLPLVPITLSSLTQRPTPIWMFPSPSCLSLLLLSSAPLLVLLLVPLLLLPVKVPSSKVMLLLSCRPHPSSLLLLVLLLWPSCSKLFPISPLSFF